MGSAPQRAGRRARNVSEQGVIHAEYQAILPGSRNPTMSIQDSQVKGDVVELIFNPRAEDLRVGETLRIHDRDSGERRGGQVIPFRMGTCPPLIQDQLASVTGNPEPLSRELLTYLSEAQ